MGKLYAHIPETVPTKEIELGAEERRLANFVDFIGEGRGSQALGKALLKTERRVEALREELDGMRRAGFARAAPGPGRPGSRFEFLAMVEAGGIEPPSEGDPPRATTCVARVLVSPPRLPRAGSSGAIR